MSTLTRLEIDDGSMSMWMILRSHRREVRRVADHAVVETRADGDQHVAVLHRHVGFVRAVHAEHAEELRVERGIGAQAHQRVGDRVTEQVGQLAQLTRRIAQDDAAAGVDVRTLGRAAAARPCGSGPNGPSCHRVVRAHLDLVGGTYERRLCETSFGMSTTTGPGRPVRAM
jgi:hypothetical protein